jgi:hypothetical protein
MTDDPSHVALAAILDSLTLMQGQLDGLAKSSARIEQAHAEVLRRLDTIDAGQVGLTDLVPILETILARMIDDRAIQRDGLERVAQVAAFAHAAALGNGAPLPTDAADDPLLERFLVSQPADRVTPDRALIAWRETVADAGTAELVTILASQYQPSPTDTPETRVLRYRLAAITRAELLQRGRIFRLCQAEPERRTNPHKLDSVVLVSWPPFGARVQPRTVCRGRTGRSS